MFSMRQVLRLNVRAVHRLRRAIPPEAPSFAPLVAAASAGAFGLASFAHCHSEEAAPKAPEGSRCPFSQTDGHSRPSALHCEAAAVAALGKTNWASVKEKVVALLEDDKYMDEPLGPLMLRLAWHASGTFEKQSGTGGSDGATMRFEPELGWGANAGLGLAQKILQERIKPACPSASIADMWIFCACVAVEQMSGGECKPSFREGRVDKSQVKGSSGSPCPAWESEHAPAGKLPSATNGGYDKDAAHLRLIFNRMGFDDREIVCLSGAHALGRCHEDRSGFWGPWTYAPTTVSSEYFRLLTEEKWTPKKTHNGKPWTGPPQLENPSGELMMLHTDYCLVTDPVFKKYVVEYAKDEAKFLADFAKVLQKLFELGVPFQERYGKGAKTIPEVAY